METISKPEMSKSTIQFRTFEEPRIEIFDEGELKLTLHHDESTWSKCCGYYDKNFYSINVKGIFYPHWQFVENGKIIGKATGISHNPVIELLTSSGTKLRYNFYVHGFLRLYCGIKDSRGNIVMTFNPLKGKDKGMYAIDDINYILLDYDLMKFLIFAVPCLDVAIRNFRHYDSD